MSFAAFSNWIIIFLGVKAGITYDCLLDDELVTKLLNVPWLKATNDGKRQKS